MYQCMVFVHYFLSLTLFTIFLILVYDVICFRQNGPFQPFSRLEVGGTPSDEAHAGYSRLTSKPSHLMPHTSQSSPSRLGQQHQRFNHGRPVNTVRSNDWNHMKIQQNPSSHNSGAVGSHTAGNSSFSNSMSWGIS